MTDLLDELRDADPVDRATLEIPPELAVRVAAGRDRRRARRRPPGAVLIATALAVAALVAVVLGGGDGRGRLSLADRAYAATAGRGIRHWTISIRTYINGTWRGIVQRQEGWTRGGTL